jgi:hypothetical protein
MGPLSYLSKDAFVAPWRPSLGAELSSAPHAQQRPESPFVSSHPLDDASC